MLNSLIHSVVRYGTLSIAMVGGVMSAFADVSFSGVSASSAAPGVATVSATVTGTGDVFAEYAHAKNPQTARSVKSRYSQDGLIAMWDGEDNMGTGAHVPGVQTWRDLVGCHADMTFTASPTIGANYYDLSAGGCGVPASDIAKALNDGQVTVEIVCDVRSVVNSGTIFSCVDGTDTASGAAGNRLAWVSHNNGAVIGVVDYNVSAYSGQHPEVDTTLNAVRTYAFKFNPSDAANYCVTVKNGETKLATTTRGNVKGSANNAWFALGQRICAAGSSAAIADMRVYCVRVYDRILSAEELAGHYAVDAERFISADMIDLDNPGKAVVTTTRLGSVGAPTAMGHYETDGLIAMWDGEDNQGTGAHVADATTWVDLTGKHAAMQFDTAPTVGATYYDVATGGCCIKSCVDIAQAIQSKNATIEIVCDVRSLADDSGTLFSLVDGSGTDAGNRLVWVMNGKTGTNHQGVIGTVDYLTDSSSTPYPSYDQTLNQVRSYSFKFGSAQCDVYRDGSSTAGTSKVVGKNSVVTQGNAGTASFSIGQRYSQGGKSAAIADMKVYCVRVYNRQLSAKEIAANHAVDVKRFYGATSELSIGVQKVTGADGTVSYAKDGVATFRLSGLRPDVVRYTVRLKPDADAAASSSVAFYSASEVAASAWYEFVDSRYNGQTRISGVLNPNGAYIDLGFSGNNQVPVVETKFQMLTTAANMAFGTWCERTSMGVAAGIFDASHLRFRAGDGVASVEATTAELTAAHELVLNGANGTWLDGDLISGDLSGKSDSDTMNYLVFARNHRATQDGGKTYFIQKDWCNARIWNFKLSEDGESVRDLVPANGPDGRACFYDRVTRTFLPNAGTLLLAHGAEKPGLSLADPVIEADRLRVTLEREGTEMSDVYVAYGDSHGGAIPADWEHFEKLPVGFGAEETSVALTLSPDVTSCAYVRFFSYADGWSDSAFIPETRIRKGLAIMVR